MLAYQDGASSPPGAMARMESVTGGRAGDRGLAAGMAVAQVANIKEQTALLMDQQAKTNAERRLTEANAVIQENLAHYSADTARIGLDTAQRNFEKLGFEIQDRIRDISLKDIDIQAMKPLVLEYQRFINTLTKANIPEAQATERFWKGMTQSEIAKWLQIVRSVMPSVGPIGVPR
jgi:hypothetical protein